jgi:2-hydroxychromene-2-carboxylate isomerase
MRNQSGNARISVTHISDPGCPFAYSAMPFMTALRWRYGDQLEWRHVLIGLTEHRSQYAERGFTPLTMARSYRRLRRHGMPFTRALKPYVAGTARACRTVVATRLVAPEREWEVFRALQFTQFTTALPIDEEPALRDALARVPGLDADEILSRLDAPEVTDAYAADRAEARSAAGSPAERLGRTVQTDGPVRYTAPALIFETEDGRRLEAGGFQPVEAYDLMIANLEPGIARRGAATEAERVLEAFPYALTTREVAVCMADGTEMPDDEAAEDQLLDLVARGEAAGLPLGDGMLWAANGSRFHREPAGARTAAAG